MNAKSANSIPIDTYLQHLGIYPNFKLPGYFMYKSIIRPNDDKPSLKVDLRLNLWCDYGASNTGGSLVDLVLKLHQNFTVSDAIKNIANTVNELNPSSFSLHQHEIPISNKEIEEKTYQILKVKSLENNALLAYSNSRGINERLAKEYLKEVYYQSTSGKRFFSLGMQNEASGWNLRNIYHKNVLGHNSYTLLQGTEESKSMLAIVEGFFDALSLLVINKKLSSFDILILNSCANVSKIREVINQYQCLKLGLDNDLAGERASEQIIKMAAKNQKIINCSTQFMPHHDINEYLISNLNKF